jgi:hypothetical protein
MSNPGTAIGLPALHPIYNILTVFPDYCIDIGQIGNSCKNLNKKGTSSLTCLFMEFKFGFFAVLYAT